MGIFDFFKGKKENSNDSVSRVNWNDTEDVGIVTHFRGKPFTGVCFGLHENGNLKDEYEMLDGLKHGKAVTYYDNGKLKEELYCKDDKLDGLSMYYHDNGQLFYESNYIDGDFVEITRGLSKDGKSLSIIQLKVMEKYIKNQASLESATLPENVNQSSKDENLTGTSMAEAIKLNGTEVLDNLFYYEGKPLNGTGFLIYENGNYQLVNNWKEGKKHGENLEYYENGQLKIKSNYKEGIKNGFEKGYYENGQPRYEGEWKGGLQVGKVISYNLEGLKVKESLIVDGEYDGEQQEWWSNGESRALRIYKSGVIVSSKLYDENGNEIEGLQWFKGDFINHNIKIRKYNLTNRYIFNPRLIWLSPIASSIISHLLLFLYSKSNYEESKVGGGIKAKELPKNKETNLTIDLEFEESKSKVYLEETILLFKKNFPSDYNMIFNDNKTDDITELSKYKMLIHPWMFSSELKNDIKEEKILPKQLFRSDYLRVLESFNKDFKKWIVTDTSVKPNGIVYESESKEKCLSWINIWK